MLGWERCWNDWLASHGLPTCSNVDEIAPDVVWRHPKLPGEFSFDWRFTKLPATSSEPQILFWRPSEQRVIPLLAEKKLLAIASSRMGRRLDGLESWLAGLRTAVCEVYRQGHGLVTAEGTSTHLFVGRMADLLHLPHVVLRAMPEKIAPSWFAQVATRSSVLPGSGSGRYGVNVFWTPLGSRTSQSEQAGQIDFELLSGADAVRLLAVRGKRNTYHAAVARLRRNIDAGDVWLLHDESLTAKSIREELIGLGAVDWVLRQPLLDDEVVGERESWSTVDFVSASTIPDVEKFLVHATRTPRLIKRRPVENEEIDCLLFKQTLNDAGPLAGLLRILADGRLRGGNDLLPGGLPMVSWTSQPLPRLRELRVYRKHLARWDFEPFGIAVRREKLLELGARRVTYVHDDAYRALKPEERAFCQRSGSQIGGEWIDWTREREWRLLGDLNLSLLGPADALVFVGDQESARMVAPYSRWQVVLVD